MSGNSKRVAFSLTPSLPQVAHIRLSFLGRLQMAPYLFLPREDHQGGKELENRGKWFRHAPALSTRSNSVPSRTEDLTVVDAAVVGTERPSARKRVTTPGTSVRSCRRVVIERKGRNRFGGGRSVKRITRIPAKKNLPVLRPAGEKKNDLGAKAINACGE